MVAGELIFKMVSTYKLNTIGLKVEPWGRPAYIIDSSNGCAISMGENEGLKRH
mgnify:CR=1 FL=1